MTDREGMTLGERVHEFALMAQKMTAADRAAVWILDGSRHEMWTVIPTINHDTLTEICLPTGQGYLGLVVETREQLNIPFDLYDEKNSSFTQQVDQKVGYRTCSLLCTPIFNVNHQLVGVIQLINKRRKGQFPAYDPAQWPQAPDCFKASFDVKDQQYLMEFGSQIAIAIAT